MTSEPPILKVGQEPPPMHRLNGSTRGTRRVRHQGKAKGKAARRKGNRLRVTGDRFAVLNTFADFTLSALTRGEIAVWLLLWRYQGGRNRAHVAS